jgi:hypothetical protein
MQDKLIIEILMVSVFLLVLGWSTIIGIIKERNRQKHIEKIISSLPENERSEFIEKYLNNSSEIMDAITE